MKWYDYLTCIGCADIIASGAMNFNIFTIGYGIVLYLFWENLREWEINGCQ